MQPVLSVATETPGVIYVNGRMVGEADGDHAPMLPVSPYGAVIVEHRPFGGNHLPLCARLVFSAGEPVAASLAGQAGVSAICWPGGATELMLAPFCLRGAEQASLEGGLELRLRAEAGELFCRGAAGCASCAVPCGAEMPSVHRMGGAIVLVGACPDGQYAVALDEGCRRVLFSDHAREAALRPDGTLNLLRALDDMPGHAQAETWLVGESMDAPLSVEPAWLDGGPRLPASPLDAALTAVRCAQLDEMDAAAACFDPATPCREALEAAAAFDGALPLKYPAPNGEACVGLVKALGDNLIRVTAVPYRCAPGGPRGWRLTELGIADAGRPVV